MRALPSTIDEAISLLAELGQTQPGQNQKFVLLARRLMNRYPSLETDGDEEIPQSEWAWSEGLVDGKTNNAAYGIALNTGLLSEVQPFVVKEANALGLCVMDEQAGAVYLADGKALTILRPATSRSAPAENYEDVPKTRVLGELVFERLVPLLSQYGYRAKKSNRSFKCTFPNGWHEIFVRTDIDRWPLRAEFDIVSRSRIHPVSDLIAAVAMPELRPEDVKDLYTMIARQYTWMDEESGGFISRGNKEYLVHSHSEVDVVMQHLVMKLQTRLLPNLEKCKTIKGLDEMLNPEFGSSSPFGQKQGGLERIITAYLAGNPDLNKLSEAIYLAVQKSGDGERAIQRARRCIDYVRDTSNAKPQGIQ